MILLELKRFIYRPQITLGVLRVKGEFECFIAEDVVRPDGAAKVPGKTAIPVGRYPLVITESPKFKRELPLVMNVPGFTGIRIHSGNDEHDTEGCPLTGRKLRHDELGVPNGVLESVLAFDPLFAKLKAFLRHDECFLDVRNS